MDRDAILVHLFARHHARLVHYFKLSFRLSVDDALDLTQNVFLRLFRGHKLPESFDEFEEWFFLKKVARHVALDALRDLHAAKRRADLTSINELEPPELPSDHPTPEDELELREEAGRLQSAIDELPEPLRQSIALQIQGYTRTEIAARLGLDISTVSARLRAARSSLLKLVATGVAIREDRPPLRVHLDPMMDAHAPGVESRSDLDARAILRFVENLEQLAIRHRQVQSQLASYERMLSKHDRLINQRLELLVAAIGDR
jgi:RNA polymerase sigma factor (sigma-70 family)